MYIYLIYFLYGDAYVGTILIYSAYFLYETLVSYRAVVANSMHGVCKYCKVCLFDSALLWMLLSGHIYYRTDDCLIALLTRMGLGVGLLY